MKRALFAIAITLSACGGPKNGPPPTAVERLNAEGVRRLDRGDDPGAEAMFRDALREAELVDDLGGEAQAWNNLGALALARGDLEQAFASHAAALRLHEQRGVRDEAEVRTRADLGTALLALGRTDDAQRQFDEAIALATHLGRPDAALLAEVGRAAVLLRVGKAAEALEAAGRAATDAGRAKDEAAKGGALAIQGVAFEATGRLDEAKRALERALDVDRARGAPRGVRDDLRALARVAERRGDAKRAAELLSRTARIARRLGDLAGASRDLDRAIALARGTEAAAGLEAERAVIERVRSGRAGPAKREDAAP